MSDKTVIWMPGGVSKEVSLELAKAFVLAHWEADDGYNWESRIPGVDLEESWNSGDHTHKTLAEAVAMALPEWAVANLGFVQAALLCFAIDLVVSTGDQIEYEGTEGEDHESYQPVPGPGLPLAVLAKGLGYA